MEDLHLREYRFFELSANYDVDKAMELEERDYNDRSNIRHGDKIQFHKIRRGDLLMVNIWSKDMSSITTTQFLVLEVLGQSILRLGNIDEEYTITIHKNNKLLGSIFYLKHYSRFTMWIKGYSSLH